MDSAITRDRFAASRSDFQETARNSYDLKRTPLKHEKYSGFEHDVWYSNQLNTHSEKILVRHSEKIVAFLSSTLATIPLAPKAWPIVPYGATVVDRRP